MYSLTENKSLFFLQIYIIFFLIWIHGILIMIANISVGEILIPQKLF